MHCKYLLWFDNHINLYLLFRLYFDYHAVPLWTHSCKIHFSKFFCSTHGDKHGVWSTSRVSKSQTFLVWMNYTFKGIVLLGVKRGWCFIINLYTSVIWIIRVQYRCSSTVLERNSCFSRPQPLMSTSDERCVTDAAPSCTWLQVHSHWPRRSRLLVCICTQPVWADKLLFALVVALHHCWLLCFHHQSLELTLRGNRLLLLTTIASKRCQCEHLLRTNITP